MAKLLVKGARITGAQRGSLGTEYAERYQAGESIRSIAESAGRSFGFVHGVLREAGVSLRSRGGSVPGSKRAAAPAKKTSAKKAAAKKTSAKKAVSKKTAAQQATTK